MKTSILITVDCLRPDHLSCYGYPFETTPVIDSIAESGTIYSHAFSNGGGTPEAFPSLLLGQPPPFHWKEYGGKGLGGLAMRFKDKGYTTGGFHSNPYLSRFYGFGGGFDIFEDGLKGHSRSITNSLLGTDVPISIMRWLIPEVGLPAPKVGIWDATMRILTSYHGKKDATQITDEALSWLSKQRGDTFLWIHYMDTHLPYLPPSRFLNTREDSGITFAKFTSAYKRLSMKGIMPTAEDIKTLITLYDCCIRFVDSEIGKLLAFLEAHDLDYSVVITSDHGDAFMEHGKINHQDVHEEIIHVPLIIGGSRPRSPSVIDTLASSIDLGDLIISNAEDSQLASQSGSESVISVSLNPIFKRRSISLRTSDWKYIRTDELHDDGKTKFLNEELYKIAIDPKENSDVSKAYFAVTGRFHAKVDSLLTLHSAQLEIPEKRQNDDEESVRTRLRRLGYE
ncbi:MAG: sulfatase-like hydrolase/transferase [Nitrososphaerota archaeon]|nr:sulfatase-like hydrolase/transferase [Nitrososphaerota archaeon]